MYRSCGGKGEVVGVGVGLLGERNRSGAMGQEFGLWHGELKVRALPSITSLQPTHLIPEERQVLGTREPFLSPVLGPPHTRPVTMARA